VFAPRPRSGRFVLLDAFYAPEVASPFPGAAATFPLARACRPLYRAHFRSGQPQAPAPPVPESARMKEGRDFTEPAG